MSSAGHLFYEGEKLELVLLLTFYLNVENCPYNDWLQMAILSKYVINSLMRQIMLIMQHLSIFYALHVVN